MNAGFYSTPCSLTWPPRIHPIYEHHSVNKPPTKQRSMLSLHNLYWLLSYLRSDFINSLGCPAHPTGYNLGKGLQGNSTCNPVTLKPHRWKGFFFFLQMCEFMKWDSETREFKNNDILALRRLSQIHVTWGKKRTSLPCLLKSYLSMTSCQIEERCEDEVWLFIGDSGVHSCHFPVDHVSAAGYPQASVGVCLY